ncbi:hypothetical protein BGZ65_012110, partial [Modicella reniformis]
GIITSKWPTDCVAAAAIDVGIFERIDVADLSIDFTLADHNVVSFSSSQLTAKLISVGFNWPVTESSQHANFEHDGNVVATGNTISSPATFANGIISTTVQKTSLEIHPTFFGIAMASIISLPKVNLTIRGTVDATLSTNAPFIPKSFKVSGIGYEAPTTLKGCANFPNIVFQSQVSLTVDPATGVYTLTAQINVPNPSQLIMTLGDLTFQLVDTTNLVVGTVLLTSVQLNMKNNQLKATIKITNKSTYDALLIGPVTFTMKGFADTSTNPVLVTAFNSLKTPFTIPKLTPAA